jgi:hypothetical protein
MNFKMMWKEVVVAKFKVLTYNLQREAMENHDISVRIVSVCLSRDSNQATP